MLSLGGSVQKLVIVGQDQDRLENLKREMKPIQEELSDLRISVSRPTYLATAIDSRLKLLVFDTNIINKMLFPFVVQVRKTGYSGPILVLGNPGSNFDIAELATVKNLFQINKPYTGEQLEGMVKNCINLENLRQRRDQRFSVREKAVLEAYSSDLKIDTIINNISRSGVRIEGNLGGLQKGDVLRLHFNFDKINKERTMSARVVWMKKENDNAEQAGLEFVSQKAVYKFLLESAAA